MLLKEFYVVTINKLLPLINNLILIFFFVVLYVLTTFKKII
jgi:hypothetical protein